jgi:hypothetical protein
MRVVLGAHERTAAELVQLLRSVDLEHIRTQPIGAGYSFIEARAG